jgi:hypothetical protein
MKLAEQNCASYYKTGYQYASQKTEVSQCFADEHTFMKYRLQHKGWNIIVLTSSDWQASLYSSFIHTAVDTAYTSAIFHLFNM